jgi:hypothetical protein
MTAKPTLTAPSISVTASGTTNFNAQVHNNNSANATINVAWYTASGTYLKTTSCTPGQYGTATTSIAQSLAINKGAMSVYAKATATLTGYANSSTTTSNTCSLPLSAPTFTSVSTEINDGSYSANQCDYTVFVTVKNNNKVAVTAKAYADDTA